MEIKIQGEVIARVVLYQTLAEAQKGYFGRVQDVQPPVSKTLSSRLRRGLPESPSEKTVLAELLNRRIWDGLGDRVYTVPLSLVTLKTACSEHELLRELAELNLRLAGVTEAFARLELLRKSGGEVPSVQHVGAFALTYGDYVQYLLYTDSVGDFSFGAYYPGQKLMGSHTIVVAREIPKRAPKLK